MSESKPGKGDILVVDDQLESLNVFTLMLTRQGYQVRTATSGQMALRAAREAPPDLVLLDVRLPDIDGYEICERFKADERLGDIPIIFMSVMDQASDKIKAFVAGGVDYVTKPLRAEELLARLETHLALRATQKQLERKNAQLEREIAERVRVEEALRESEERFRSSFEHAGVGMAMGSLDGRFLEVNRSLCNMLGYTEQELVGTKFSDVTHPDDWEIDRVNIQHMLTGQKTVAQREKRYIHKQGHTVWGFLSLSFVCDADGNPAYLIAQVQDITERIRSEEERTRAVQELRKRQAHQALVLGSLPMAFYISQPFGDYDGTWVSEQINRISGFTAEQHTAGNRLWASRLHPEDRERVLKEFGKLVDKGAIELEYRWQAADGRYLWFLDRAVLIRNEKGEPKDVVGTWLDITERVRVEKERARAVEGQRKALAEALQATHALRESEELLNNIVESMSDGILVLDPDFHYVYWNRAMERISKTPREEVIDNQKIAWEIFPHLAEQGVDRLMQRAMRGEIVRRQNIPYHLRNGTGGFTSEIFLPLRTSTGGIRGIVGVVRDTTEHVRAEQVQRQMEEQLRQQERLAAIGQLAGGIAHDFNNLLTSIILYAQIIRGDAHLPPNLASSAENILHESRRAAELVQQILDFSRRAMIETRPVDLTPFIERIIGTLRRTLPESIRLTLDEGGGEYVVKADPTRIQQVVMNLATNARDAMAEGGELRIGLSRVRVRAGEKPPVAEMGVGEWVCLAVSDTGTGMTEEVQSHLFEPFFTTKEVGKGTGLGLAQVHGIVKQHGGCIGVETAVESDGGVGANEDVGTTFRVYLPAYKEGVEGSAEKALDAPLGKGETVLLVEDDDSIRDAGQSVLESLGYRVVAAVDGREALEVYRSAGGVDLVITDVVMPEMGGRQLFQELREMTPDIKILAITGYGMQEDLEALREDGFLGVVHKPFDVDALAQVVRRALDVD